MPIAVQLRSKVSRFSLGEVHTLVLTAHGDVYTFGNDGFGATCNGTVGKEEAPERIQGLHRCELPLRDGEEVVDVAAGGFHSMVLTSHHRVLIWGDNSHGQLGSDRKDGFVYSLLQDAQTVRKQQPHAPTSSSSPHLLLSVQVRVDDAEIDRELSYASEIGELSLPLHSDERPIQLVTRSFHTAVVTDYGRLLLFGDNAYGQIGLEPLNHSAVGDSQLAIPLGPSQSFFVSSVALGELHSLALSNASTMRSFGLNTRHQLGRMRGATWDAFPMPPKLPYEDPDEHVQLIAAGGHFSAAVTNLCQLYVWGEPLLAEDTRLTKKEALPPDVVSRTGRAAEAGGGGGGGGVDGGEGVL